MDIYPSLITADLLNLQKEIEDIEDLVDGFHIDIMDDNFVPNLTWGNMFINAISSATKKPLWIHLMVENVNRWIEHLDSSSVSTISIHIEANIDIGYSLRTIKEKNIKASLAISPKTKIENCFPFLEIVDQILIMSVEPGFAGQLFKKDVLNKTKPLMKQREKQNLSFSIAMDGGINKDNIFLIQQHGITESAISTGIFSQPNRSNAIKDLNNAL